MVRPRFDSAFTTALSTVLGCGLAAGLAIASAGCDTRTVPLRDGGGRGDGGTPTDMCTAGTAGYRCEGNIAVECLVDGSEGSRQSCADTSQICVPGPGTMGCRTCRPGTYQCQGNDVQLCNADGSAWMPHASCDAASGQTCNAALGICSSPCDEAAAANSYIGCEYFPVTTLNSQVAREFSPAIVVSNPQAESVMVTVTGPAGFNQIRSVATGATETIELPWVQALKGELGTESSTIQRGAAYRVVSTLPVSVYQFNPLEYRIARDCINPTTGDCDSSTVDDFFGFPECDNQCFSHTNDASMLLPTHVMTGNYIVLGRPTLQLDAGGGPVDSPGFFTVVGVAPTQVTVNIQFRGHVEASTDGSIRAFAPGETGTFMLNQGDVLQLVGTAPPSCTPGSMDMATYCTVGPEYDFTGTEVRATGPVEVIAGHNCAFVPYNRWACDHLEEALFPLETWGQETIMSRTQAPMGRTEPNIVRIISGADNNTLTFEPASVGGGTMLLNRGGVHEFEATESFRVTGTAAFLMGQFVVGQDFAGLGTSGEEGAGDPAMSLGIPSEQFRTSYTFLAPSSYPTNFVNVTAPSGATVMLDGSPVSGFAPVGGTGFGVSQVMINSGQHTITSDQPFGIVVYGYGTYTSYMYPGGLDFEEINPLI